MTELSDNKRIAKNTLLLYIRQLCVMLISLYTSRVVLATLGVSDYGIYNVVGSVVTMFTFIRSAMGNATMRYIAFEIGKGGADSLKRVFSTTIYVHAILALIIFVFAESVGLWLLYNKMDIPADRMTAAFWVLQFSVFHCIIGVLCVPYDAEIMAHEKMGAFAFLAIIDVVMKLLLILLLTIIPWDKLIFYGLFLLLAQILNRIIYNVYCYKKFHETRSIGKPDKTLVKEMFGFASWNVVGNMATIGCEPLLNILLNMFCGTVVNAARGVAYQIQGAIRTFVTNFQIAVNPQITKSYAAGNIARMHDLIIYNSRLAFYLFSIFAIPLFFEADGVLSIWLVDVPEHSVAFLRIVLLILLVESWERPLHTSNLATGKVRTFQSVKGLTLLLMVPFSYLALKMGLEPEWVFVIQFAITAFSLSMQLLMIRKLINLSLKRYCLEVVLQSLIILVIASIIPFLFHLYFKQSILTTVLNCVIGLVSAAATIFFIGLKHSERMMIVGKIKQILKIK